MLTWDSELENSFKKIVNTVHYPDQPFSIVQMVRDCKRVIETKAYFGTGLEHIHRFRRQADAAHEFYMALGITHDENFTISNFTGSWAVAIDFDNGLPDLCKPGQPFAPTLAIETSADRFHCVWVVDKLMTLEEMNRLVRAMADRLEGDMAFARVNQLIRLPGFVNQKYGTLVKLRDALSSGKTYSYSWLWKASDADLYEAGVRTDQPQINHITKNALRDKPETVMKHLEAALDHLKDCGYAEKYDDWIKVVLNLAALGRNGHDLALSFSRGSAKFDQSEFEDKWNKVLKTSSGSVSTIFSLAQQKGWKNPGWADAEGGEAPRAPSEREFGAEIAREIVATVAAIELSDGSRQKQSTVFCKWTECGYVVMHPRDKRAAIADAAAKVLKRKRDAGSVASQTLAKKVGNNRSLDELADHVAETLVPLCNPRVVTGYPHLPVANGVLNMLTGQLVPYRYKPIPMQACNVIFDPATKAERFPRFLDEVLNADTEMIRFVLRVLGYALLGRPTEQVMVVLLGPSGNGKSTLMDVMMAILGPFATRLRTETLMQKSHVSDGANPAMSSLAGTRLVVVAEPNQNHKLDTSLVKQLTGERSIPVRGLYSDGRNMQIEFCMFMTANFMPFATAEDKGLWRRMLILPFDRVFAPDEIDKDLQDTLIAESSGILNMLLEGVADYQAQGLNPPVKVTQAVEVRRQEADSFEVFLQACADLEPLAVTQLKEIWTNYGDWAKANPKFRPMLKTELQDRLKAKFERRTRSNLPVFIGLKMTSTANY